MLLTLGSCPLAAQAGRDLGLEPSRAAGLGSGELILAWSSFGAGLAGAQVFESMLVPSRPRWRGGWGPDDALRDALRWGSITTAERVSSGWTLSVVLGGLFMAPLGSEHPYGHQAALVAEAAGFTALATGLIKAAVGRQRPYARFATRASRGRNDNASFPSGDTSWSFAVAVSNASLLGREHPEQAPLIWASSLSAAGIAGYLRLAADRHYLSDVMAGAALGSAFGLLVPLLHYDTYFGSSDRRRKARILVLPAAAPQLRVTGRF
ncbi:MAG: phosphatase PAP2 family protein [Proteobacteria bacterium]|nr:phosphatase PAP2 family protein [Pseudomonadota bacterium]